MTDIARTHKEGESKSMTNKTTRSGIPKNGKRQNRNTSELIHSVASVEIRLRFPIMKTSRIMGNQHISIFLTQDPIVTFVTGGTISAGINVPSVENFVQNPKGNHAITACRRALICELCNANKIETTPKTGSTGPCTESIIRKKSSTRRQESGK